ncbi:hypothetical protein [Ferrimonas lipolytica]|uniref:Cytochrome c554 and c-prime n=1 Tax=Ferrimonas lipolytica TaxID=2724191 RepID=A0A6H1UDH0_9GAMM|nr:hypothetical protein [Ferrimonas lipolytica]QIZ76640.1 hypothetical protein HER31_07015 [Ferrimonas lipolytica]
MMSLKKLPLAIALSSLLALSGCGSDSDSSTADPINGEIPEVGTPQTGTGVFDNVWGPDIKWQLEGPITVYFDKMSRADWVAQTEERFSDLEHGFTFDAEDVRRVVPKPLRDDLFHDGQITFAEVLVYLSETRDDFHLEYEWGEDIGAFRYTVWRNEDGSPIEYDADGQPIGEGDPNWYANWISDTGDFKREFNYNNWGESVTHRLELTVLQSNSGILLRSLSPAYTERREEMQKTQTKRRNEAEATVGENRIIVPMVTVKPVGGEAISFTDVEVRSHNLRPDIYKKDAMITLADVFLSMDEQGLIDVEFSYWGKLSTDVDIQHFVINSVNGVRNQARLAYVIDAFEQRNKADWNFKYGVGRIMAKGFDGTFCDGIGFDGKASGAPIDGIIDDECVSHYAEKGIEIDISDWYGAINKHTFADVWPMQYPIDHAMLVNKQLGFVPADTNRFEGDGKFEIADIDDAIRPLSEAHFGWGIADCGTCHSLASVHSDGDIGTLGVNPTPVSVMDGVMPYEPSDADNRVVAPYQCAQCHGSNGAPKGHGEIGQCFWCHDNEFEFKNHGSANRLINKMYEGGNITNDEAIAAGATFFAEEIIDIPSTDLDAVEMLRESHFPDKEVGYLTNNLAPVEGQNFAYMSGLYKDDMKVRSNSDWTIDPVYPDPYSCMTCHPNK